MTQTSWPSTDIHTMFGPDLTPQGGLDWDRIQAFARFTLESFIGQIAVAFGGIDILGWKPFDFLADWGQARIDEATANYLAATTAQNAANYANAQLTGLLTTDVSGGVALYTAFDGSAATPVPGWTQNYEGPGGGSMGIDGSGYLVWNASGGFWRASLGAHPTPLTTNYQRGRIVVTTLPDAAIGGGVPGIYIILRSNAAADELVFARITRANVNIGMWSAGTETILDTTSVTTAVGDAWDFYAGTPTDDRQFIIKQNGNVVRTYTDGSAVTPMGSGYRYVGAGMVAPGYIIYQGSPGKVTAWAAIDRQVTTV